MISIWNVCKDVSEALDARWRYRNECVRIVCMLIPSHLKCNLVIHFLTYYLLVTTIHSKHLIIHNIGLPNQNNASLTASPVLMIPVGMIQKLTTPDCRVSLSSRSIYACLVTKRKEKSIAKCGWKINFKI